MFKNSSLTESELVNIYNRVENFTYDYDSKGPLHKRRRDYIKEVLLNINPDYFLDVGCGDGYFIKLLREKDKFAVGIDISESLLKKFHLSDFFLVGNATAVPLKSGYFDAILASQLVEHIFDYSNFFLECYRLLKPKGYLILTVPNLFCYDSLDSVFKFQKFAKKLFRISPTLHINKHLPANWKRIIINSNFKVVHEKALYIFPYIPYFLKNVKSLESRIMLNQFIWRTFKYFDDKIASYFPFKYLGQIHFFLCQK